MSHVQWCVGNTTLREAKRIKDALRVLKKNFDNQPWSYENQKRFLQLLSETTATGSNDPIYDMGSSKNLKQVEQHGRIWSSAFNELGFATCYKKGNKYVPSGVHITSVGNAFLSDELIEEDIWLRQLLKIQFPNPLPQKTSSQYPGFALLPFPAVLTIMKECEGISKDEGFIINTIKSSQEVDVAIDLIKEFRGSLRKMKHDGKNAVRKKIAQAKRNWAMKLYAEEIRSRIQYIKQFRSMPLGNGEDLILQKIIRGGKGARTKKALRLRADLIASKRKKDPLSNMKKLFLNYFLRMKSDAWQDYLDATSRYFRMSGILTIRRNKITIAETHKDIADWVISQRWSLRDDVDYLHYLHDSVHPVLPQDRQMFLSQTVRQTFRIVSSQLSEKDTKLIDDKLKKADDSLKLRKLLVELYDRERELKEQKYMEALHARPDAAEEIIKYFDAIMENEVLGDRPTHFEWNIWRGFLAIDKIIKHPQYSRNFRIDDELQPVSHAPGNRADMVFSYDDYILVVEVTLQTGQTQYSAESEPVTRHVVKIISQERERVVYALFIAPTIHLNTALHFYGVMKSVPVADDKGEKFYPKIIPITLSQYCFILEAFKNKRFSPSDLRRLLESILDISNRYKISDGGDWVRCIDGVTKEWVSKL